MDATAGNSRLRYDYQSYGKLEAGLTNRSLTNAYTYTGREDDGTGLYYYRARYYDPELEVFLSQDPLGDAQRYVGENPIRFTDPRGLCLEDACMVEGAVVLSLVESAGSTLTLIEGGAATGGTAAAGGSIPAGQYVVGTGLAIWNSLFGQHSDSNNPHIGKTNSSPSPMSSNPCPSSNKTYSDATKKAFEEQYAKYGSDSLIKARNSLQNRLNEHLQKISEAQANGGYTSSMEREIRTFQRQIDAINDVLGGK